MYLVSLGGILVFFMILDAVLFHQFLIMESGDHPNIKMSSYQYRIPRVEDKIISSYF